MTRLGWLPQAYSDVESARQWYETQQRGLGDQFVDVIGCALTDVLDYPDGFPVVHRGARRYLLPRFPYCLYYRLDAGDVVVIAVLHAAMNPRKTRRRLRCLTRWHEKDAPPTL